MKLEYPCLKVSQTTMYDRIKYKRAKDNEEDRNPKGKGKGKGKRSIATKPVRKENICSNTGIRSRSVTPTVVDNSNSNSMESQMVSEELEISDNEITFKSTSERDEKEGFNVSTESKSSEIDNVIKPIQLKKKRKKSSDLVSEDDPEKLVDSKKAKLDTEAEKEIEPNDNEEIADTEADLPWDDLTCLYCDQNIPIEKNRPGLNKKKYQYHLMQHFLSIQYSEIPDTLRIYQCSYKDCGYGAGNKNHYIKHIAFKHDEWYKRINRRISEALTNSEIAEELEDLSAIKEAFVTDYRIMPTIKGSNINTKPLWVDGTTLGTEEVDKESVSPDISNIESPEEDSKCKNQELSPEKEKVTESSCDDKDESPVGGELPPKESLLKNQSTTPPVPSINEETQKKATEITSEGSEKVKEKKPKNSPYLQCHFCPKIMKTDSTNILKNRNSYQIHLVESHFEASMYNDILDSEKYKCPNIGCEFGETDVKSRLRIHLAINHRFGSCEFLVEFKQTKLYYTGQWIKR